MVYCLICNFSRFICSHLCHNYASKAESISSSRDRAKFANTVLRSMFSPALALVRQQLIELKGYSGLFGTIAIILFTLILQIFFYQNLPAEQQISSQQHVEKAAPNMFKDKTLLVPLHLFYYILVNGCIDEYAIICYRLLKGKGRYVGYLASLCAGLKFLYGDTIYC